MQHTSTSTNKNATMSVTKRFSLCRKPESIAPDEQKILDALNKLDSLPENKEDKSERLVKAKWFFVSSGDVGSSGAAASQSSTEKDRFAWIKCQDDDSYLTAKQLCAALNDALSHLSLEAATTSRTTTNPPYSIVILPIPKDGFTASQLKSLTEAVSYSWTTTVSLDCVRKDVRETCLFISNTTNAPIPNQASVTIALNKKVAQRVGNKQKQLEKKVDRRLKKEAEKAESEANRAESKAESKVEVRPKGSKLSGFQGNKMFTVLANVWAPLLFARKNIPFVTVHNLLNNPLINQYKRAEVIKVHLEEVKSLGENAADLTQSWIAMQDGYKQVEVIIEYLKDTATYFSTIAEDLALFNIEARLYFGRVVISQDHKGRLLNTANQMYFILKFPDNAQFHQAIKKMDRENKDVDRALLPASAFRPYRFRIIHPKGVGNVFYLTVVAGEKQEHLVDLIDRSIKIDKRKQTYQYSPDIVSETFRGGFLEESIYWLIDQLGYTKQAGMKDAILTNSLNRFFSPGPDTAKLRALTMAYLGNEEEKKFEARR